METPLLKAVESAQDQPSPSNYGSTGNTPAVSNNANEQDVSAGNEQDMSAGSEADDRTGTDEDVSTQNTAAASTPAIRSSDSSSDKGPASHNHQGRTKKNITQGMLNFALLTANASQLKTVLDGGNSHPYFVLLLTLISLSMVLQIVAGALMAYVAKLDLNKGHNHEKCNSFNNAVGILVFLVTAPDHHTFTLYGAVSTIDDLLKFGCI